MYFTCISMFLLVFNLPMLFDAFCQYPPYHSFPPVTFLSLSNGLISRFLSRMCTEVSGVENIGQCGRLSQLSWLLGAL